MAQALRRKLTTILSADVAGYSRLMDEDEVATVETLMAYRGAIGGFVERHQGRVVSTAGDGLLADFDSVVEAVPCAAEIQGELNARNTEVAEARRMVFRIGTNLGDVIVEDGDIYGEGVNIAARLQSLAEPGGICISGTVFEQVRNKLSLGYDFLGPRAVKNIGEPVPHLPRPAERRLGHGKAPRGPRRGRGRAEEQGATDPRPATRRCAGGGSWPSRRSRWRAERDHGRAVRLRSHRVAGVVGGPG